MKITKCISLFLALAFLFPNVSVNALEGNDYYINSNGIIMSETQFLNLKSLGYSNEQISTMKQDEFDLNDNISGEIVSTETKYVKTTYVYKTKNTSLLNFRTFDYYISNVNNLSDDSNLQLISVNTESITEDEYNMIDDNTQTTITTNDVNPSIISTEYKKLTTQIIKLSNGRYRFRNDLTWKKMPSNRSYDLSAIALNNAIAEPVSGSQYARLDYKTKDSCTLETTAYEVSFVDMNSWKRSTTGYGVSMNLPVNTTKTYTWNELLGTSYPCGKDMGGFAPPSTGRVSANIDVIDLSSYMFYDVVKIGATNPLSAYGSYQHSVKKISFDVSTQFSVGINGILGGSINVTPTVATYFDGMEGTHAQLLNPDW